MGTWQPATLDDVLSILEQEMDELHPAHRARFERMRVPPRQVPIARWPGEFVWVVAEYQNKILYWSDIEGGWELEFSTPKGGIEDRGCNQYELRHIMHRLFGSLEAA